MFMLIPNHTYTNDIYKCGILSTYVHLENLSNTDILIVQFSYLTLRSAKKKNREKK